MREGFAAGVTLADGQTLAPALVEPIGSDACRARVVLRQGVYHQIKRMFGCTARGSTRCTAARSARLRSTKPSPPVHGGPLTEEELAALRGEERV